MSCGRVAASIVTAFSLSATVSAQSPRLEQRAPGPVLAAVAPTLDSARAAGLPTGPLEEKVLEGVTKQADAMHIAAAVRRLAKDLAGARAALGDRATVRELVAGAGALRVGLSHGDLLRVRAARAGQGPAVALEVATDLITQGVPPDTATRAVLSVLGTGASDADLEQLRLAVERDVAGGMPAAVAASVRARVLSGSSGIPNPVTPPPPH